MSTSAMEPEGTSGRTGLTPGYYTLTLALAALATLELRVRAPGMASFTLLELGAFPAALCLVAELMLRPHLMERLRELYRRNRAFAWYVGYGGLASVVGLARTSETLQIYKDLVPAVVLYVLVFLTVDRHERLLGLLLACLAGYLVSVGLGLSQFATGGPYLAALSEHVEAKQDLAGELVENVPTGIFSHPNALGLVLLPVAVFLVVATWPGLRRPRHLRFGMLAILLATLFVLKVTFVKGVYAWLAAALAFLALPRRLDRWRVPIACVVPLAGIVLLTWFSLRSFLEGEEHELGTILSRIELWMGAIDAVKSDGFVMLFGGGGTLMGERQAMTMDYLNAHNAWIDQALNFGLPALVLYLASFWVAFRSLGRAIRGASGPPRMIALAAMASLMGLLGENFFEPADRGVVFQAELFILFALAAMARPAPPAPRVHRSEAS